MFSSDTDELVDEIFESLVKKYELMMIRWKEPDLPSNL